MNNDLIVLLVLVLILHLVGLISVYKWIYHDAKSHGMPPWLWILLIICTGIIGLIIYFLYRRKINSTSLPRSSITYKPLILGIILMVLSISGFIYYLKASGIISKNFHYGLGLSSTNMQNEWQYSFYFLDGEVEGKFIAKSDYDRLIYSCDIEKGTINFRLYNVSDSLLSVFSATAKSDTIEGFSKGEKYRVKAIVSQAKGKFKLKME